jgi:SAM-dependent methyltransferase
MGGLVELAWRRVRPHGLNGFPDCAPLFRSRIGLELGGPSRMFGPHGSAPVYPLAARIDNCNFGSRTVWEGTIREGDSFVFNPAVSPGRQYIGEAGNLSFIDDASYDFVLSSHCIEHLANPLRGLSEWTRVLRPDGALVLVMPHKDGTFDHRRPTTTLEHLVQDFDRQMDEGDLTHLEEILRLHDLARDPGAGDPGAFETRSRLNKENRCLHHHVFDTRLAIEVVDHLHLRILSVEAFRPHHIAIVARKPGPGQAVDNSAFTQVDAAPFRQSPFPSDRAPRRAPRGDR